MADIILAQAPSVATTDSGLTFKAGSIGNLQSVLDNLNTVELGFPGKNYANPDTTLIFNAIDDKGKSHSFVLSKELGAMYKSGEIQLENCFDLPVSEAIDKTTGEIKYFVTKEAAMHKVAYSAVKKKKATFDFNSTKLTTSQVERLATYSV